MKTKKIISHIAEVITVLLILLLFGTVFYFVVINSFKSNAEASELTILLPREWNMFENYVYVFTYKDGIFWHALLNSFILTISSIAILIIVSGMTGFMVQRRKGKVSAISNILILAGLIVPPSIIPTYWMLKNLHLSGTITGLVFVEVATLFPYAVMLYRGFMVNIPEEIDEAALIDGCGPFRLYWNIVFPMLKPITATIIILRSVVVYNDFSNPLYFLQGSQNSMVQVCVYLFQSMFSSDWGYMFAAIVVVSIPPFILFILLNKQIMEGMTMGAVKG